MQHIEIEYNQRLKPLEAVLSGVKQPGGFFVCGALEIPMPKVEVEGAGALSFPVPDGQIAAIVQRAERAPYGKGEETIVDTSVRKVWQIAPGKVKIGGKSWAANFETILSKVRAGLGCDDASVTAELYKLLVYDRGGFFLAHRDTEKTAGMFGTLVVTLPSTYRGGALRLRHGGREVRRGLRSVQENGDRGEARHQHLGAMQRPRFSTSTLAVTNPRTPPVQARLERFARRPPSFLEGHADPNLEGTDVAQCNICENRVFAGHPVCP